MEGLVADLPPPENQTKLHNFIQWLRTCDGTPPNWVDYDNYCRDEQRWIETHMGYDITATLSPVAIFAIGGRSGEHKAVFKLVGHYLALELTDLQGPIYCRLR